MPTTHDFTFAWEHADSTDGPFAHLQVLRFHGREELSSLSRYELTLLAKTPAPEVDPHALIGARATLRIVTLTEPTEKLVHGVLVEAEEIAQLPDGMLYRVVLMPPLVRAQHRTRSRIFLEKTTRQIVNAVLQGDPALSLHNGAPAESDHSASAGSFTPAAEHFTWRLQDPARVDDPRVRSYCVQYNESDLAFVSRLLEEEGISYHFENSAGVCLFVLSDADQGKTRLDPFEPLGSEIKGRHVSTLKLGARLREKKVRLGDYDWRKPALDLSTEVKSTHGDLFEHRYPGGYADAATQGELLAKARLDRHHIEAEYATGEGTCRMLSAGSIFRLDHVKPRYDGEYLVTKLDVRGEQHGVASAHATEGALPFTCAFESARRGHGAAVEASRFRPARLTPKPRVVGSQTAFVTRDPSAQGVEIHVGGPPGAEIGCVRLRFHWDTEQERLSKEPSSCWVRVSQVFAGAGEGALFHPRVGTEMIVEFLDGDPDRPIVTGRVYNGANRPPVGAAGSPTVSTLKSSSSPGGSKHNELSFDDAAGSEQIKLHAGKNWDSEVGHDRSERVTNDSTSTIGVHRTESTGGNRSTSVKGTNTESVDSDEAISINANQKISISADQSLYVGANQSIAVSVSQTSGIGVNRSVTIGADDSTAVGGNRSVNVSGNLGEVVSGNAQQSVAGNRAVSVAGTNRETVAGSRSVSVSGAMTHKVAGAVSRSGAATVTEVAGASFALSAGGCLALVPQQVADASGWRESIATLHRVRLSSRVRLAVFSPPGGPLQDTLGSHGAHLHIDEGELRDYLRRSEPSDLGGAARAEARSAEL